MIFFAFTDQGLDTTPIVAADLSGAAEVVRERFGLGRLGDNVTPVDVGLVVPAQIGTVTPDGSGDPQNATLTATGDGATLATLRQNARAALVGNATFLALAAPTAAQNAAQVKALTRQVDGLIRVALAELSATS
jgi:hypothetical protein